MYRAETERIKQEPADDIKDYAKQTMNDLLGLYGYDGVNSSDTHDLDLARYTSGSRVQVPSADDANKDDTSLDSTDNSSTGIGDAGRSSVGSGSGETSLAAQHRNLVSALTKKHNLTGTQEGSLPSGCSVNCAWCQKPGSKLFPLTTGNGVKAFCSEPCFSLCRRASFKQSKKCEWCKHIRHTVNYVDFQDGDHQLQFCSEKCLNQFKMHLFCKETSEHLPKIQTKCENNDSSSSEQDNQILITPDLWLSEKNNNDQKSSKENREKDISDRDKYNTIRYEQKHTIRKHSSDSGGFDRHSVQEKNVRDKHQRTSSREKNGSQIHKPDSQQVSPNLRENIVPPHFMNSSMMPSMAQWFPQGQYMNAFSPGMSPYGGFHPMMYGFVPPQPGVMVPPHNFHQPDRSSTGQLMSPMSDRQSTTSTPVGPRISTPSQSVTPGPSSGSRKPMSSVGMPCQQRYHGDGNTPSTSLYPPMFHGQFPMNMGLSSGIPPVTVMVPFPIPLPIPIPVPIPVPMEMEQIMKILNKSTDSCGTGEVNVPDKDSQKNNNELESKHYSVLRHTARSCKSESGHIDPSKNNNSCFPCHQDRSCSRNSCPDLSLTDRCQSISSHSDSALKRMRSRSPSGIISPKRAHLSKFHPEEVCEKAIDLSKDSGHDSDRDTSYIGKENLRDPGEFQSEAKDVATGTTSQPRIHIVPTRNDPPLSQQLPLPPAESTYNFRRGLILDNPNVSKKSRSPSPERRYVRSHPQDLIESVRRRHMRSRIRTK
ncbi:hypothetical protein ScPMuIL_012828 [Solemya velum]